MVAGSSGEQGAATLALARTDLRYVPLPPGFNARPYTMLSYLSIFGIPVYHGKELWKGLDLSGQPAEQETIIAQRSTPSAASHNRGRVAQRPIRVD